MEKKIKLVSTAEAISTINDGDKIAFGGILIRRHPMAFVHELIRQNKKDLTLYGWNNGMDYDMLIGAGCVREAHSCYVGIANLGLAKNFRRAMESGTLRFIENSESVALDKFRAGSSGVSFAVSKSPLHNDIRLNSEFFVDITCPFTGEQYVAVEAFRPDVAFIHAHRADKYGNVQLDRKRMTDNEADIILAKSGKRIIVSVEEIVDEEEIIATPDLTVLPRLFVDFVVHAPYGAHPNSCDTRYDFDIKHARLYQEASTTTEGFDKYIKEYVIDTKDWNGYISKIGKTQLDSITR